MEPQNTQSNMTIEESKAALGNATYLQEQMLAMQNPQEQPTDASTEPQGGVGQAEPSQPNEDLKGLEDRLMGEIGDIKDLIEKNSPKNQDKEIEDLKKQIEDVLNQDE